VLRLDDEPLEGVTVSGLGSQQECGQVVHGAGISLPNGSAGGTNSRPRSTVTS
jgi:hypothetical protein